MLEKDLAENNIFDGRFVSPNLHGHQGVVKAEEGDGEGSGGDNGEDGAQKRVHGDEPEQGGAGASGGVNLTLAEYEASLGWRNLTDDEFRRRDPLAFGPCPWCSGQLYRA